MLPSDLTGVGGEGEDDVDEGEQAILVWFNRQTHLRCSARVVVEEVMMSGVE